MSPNPHSSCLDRSPPTFHTSDNRSGESQTPLPQAALHPLFHGPLLSPTPDLRNHARFSLKRWACFLFSVSWQKAQHTKHPTHLVEMEHKKKKPLQP